MSDWQLRARGTWTCRLAKPPPLDAPGGGLIALGALALDGGGQELPAAVAPRRARGRGAAAQGRPLVLIANHSSHLDSVVETGIGRLHGQRRIFRWIGIEDHLMTYPIASATPRTAKRMFVALASAATLMAVRHRARRRRLNRPRLPRSARRRVR